MATKRYTNEEFDMLRRWLDNNQDSASEKVIEELVDVISKDFPAEKIIAVNSCMGALHIALQTVGIGPGDEVIVDPIVTFAGMAVMYHNGVPVFADVDLNTMNADPESIKSKITSRTKAIICTHLFGSMCDMDKIMEIAKANNIPVIEDCAHALFAQQNGKYAGLHGDFAAFSFNHRKQLSTGQGGFLVINNKDLVQRSNFTKFGRIPERINWNYQMPGIIAAIAIAQWKHAKEYVRKDHELAKLYAEAIKGCEWLIEQQVLPKNWSSYHIWACTFKGEEYGIDYKKFMEVLKDNGATYFLPAFMPYGAFGLEPSPVYRYPIFQVPMAYTKGCPTACPHYEGKVDYSGGSCPNAEYLVPRMFNTVLSPIEDEKIEIYAEGLSKTIKHFS